MINTKCEMISTDIIESIVCDVCKKKYDDEWEIQEFIYIQHCGGYNSIFGDGSDIEIEVCQHCFKKMFEENYRIIYHEYDE